MKKAMGTLDFIGRNQYGIPAVKITWNDGSKETELYPSIAMANHKTEWRVKDGILKDPHNFFTSPV